MPLEQRVVGIAHPIAVDVGEHDPARVQSCVARQAMASPGQTTTSAPVEAAWLDAAISDPSIAWCAAPACADSRAAEEAGHRDGGERGDGGDDDREFEQRDAGAAAAGGEGMHAGLTGGPSMLPCPARRRDRTILTDSVSRPRPVASDFRRRRYTRRPPLHSEPSAPDARRIRPTTPSSSSSRRTRPRRPAAGDRETRRRFRIGPGAQTLLGVTGSGKTYTVANLIQAVQKPTLVMAPNKTLAAQLYGEFKAFFPHNAVEYFVSYYDYYQPEAYVPSSDTYIEKDSSINEHIEQMRLSATKALLERRDAIIVCTVSAIYGLGDPNEYFNMVLHMVRGERIDQRELIRRLTEMQYTRNEFELQRGHYRVRGETIDVHPAESDMEALRIELFDGEIESLGIFDPLTGEVLRKVPRYTIYPKSHYVTTRRTVLSAVENIKIELRERLEQLYAENKLVEAQRLQQRTSYDLEMLAEVGYCNGIENYSRHLTGRMPGEPPPCLFDYLPPDALLVVDESHVTVPQIGAMYKGDRSRKETLVEFGFRMPSALDNRPAEVRGMGAAFAAQHLRVRRRPARTNCANPPAKSSNSSYAPPAWSTRRWRSARSRPRSTIC
jgi:hypothetical protein